MAPNVQSDLRLCSPDPARPTLPEGAMLDVPFIRSLAITFPGFFTARALHHAALHAAFAGEGGTAEALYERAAAQYRLDLEVEALARLRVHQLVTRARAAGEAGREAELLLESAQRLSRLEHIESFDPPFAMIPASGLFETGRDRLAPVARDGSGGSRPGALRDAA